jgi:hypothetical protein
MKLKGCGREDVVAYFEVLSWDFLGGSGGGGGGGRKEKLMASEPVYVFDIQLFLKYI